MRTLYALMVVALLVTSGCTATTPVTETPDTSPIAATAPATESAADRAATLGTAIYAQLAANGDPAQFASGPCIADTIMKSWSVDLVHTPRDPAIDDLPENQCPAYVSGTNPHLVEIDLEGNIVRAE